MVDIVFDNAPRVLELGENTDLALVAAAQASDAKATSLAASATAQTAAAFAEEFSGPVFADTAAGVAATAVGKFFRVAIGTTPETYNRYERTGTTPFFKAAASLATTADLASTTPGKGASLVGLTSGESAQQAFEREVWVNLIFDDSSDAAATANNAALNAAFDAIRTASLFCQGVVRAKRGMAYLKTTVEIPHNIRIDAAHTRWRPAPTFSASNRGTTSCPFLFTLGSAARGDTVAFNCRINGNIDGNDFPNLGGVWSNLAQEGSGIEGATVWKWTAFGIVMEATGGRTPQNFILAPYLITPSDTVSGKQCIRLSGNATHGVIKKPSITTGAGGSAQDVGIVVNAARAYIEGAHIENCTDGVRFQNGCSGVVMNSEGYDGGGLGLGLVTNVVKINADAGDVAVIGCREFGATNLVADLKNGITIAKDVREYISGDPGIRVVTAPQEFRAGNVAATPLQIIGRSGQTAPLARFDPAPGRQGCQFDKDGLLALNGLPLVQFPATGWEAPTGTLSRATFSAGISTGAGATYSQAEANAVLARIAALEQRQAALVTDLNGGPIRVGYNAATAAFIARFSVAPNTVRSRAYDQWFYAMVSAGVLAKLDAFYLIGADAQCSALNLVQNAFNLVHGSNGGAAFTSSFTTGSGVTFTADRGWLGNGTSGLIDTGFNPALASTPKFTLNSASMGLYSRTNLSNGGANSNDMGATRAAILRASSGTASQFRTNSAGTLTPTTAVSYPGSTGWTRSAANLWSAYDEGVLTSTMTDTSSAIESSAAGNTFRVLRNGLGYGANEIAALFYGGALTADDWLVIAAATRTYLTAIGAAV